LHGRNGRIRLALRAVVFDYGLVLTGSPDPSAHAEMLRITGLPPERFDALYWADRDAFDAGGLLGRAFWKKLAREAGISVSPSTIEELVALDARMWMTENSAMLAWQLMLKQHGLLTAIVSNMGDTVHHAMKRELPWLARFDVLVWSYLLRITKPDPAIYRHVLEKLGTRPEETLFIDDRKANVDAAVAIGMKGIVFTDVERLRADLIAVGLDKEIPLP
ncbi:MAG: HAD family phosphatase, partial [Terracidiphilus sp.]